MNSRWLLALCLAGLAPAAAAQSVNVAGVVWQLHEKAPEAKGAWHRLGARELVVQWTAVDGIAYVPGGGMRASQRMPDWRRIAAEPWAERVIVGLSGRTDEKQARQSLGAMLEESLALTRLRFPFRVSGWYFPAEVDPSWREAREVLPPVLERLPRPLWISAYDNGSIGAQEFAAWLAAWLPPHVGVLFQDGVGIHVRKAAVAREYADALAERLGRERVAVIAEAFRTDRTHLRPATADELGAQLSAYRGLRIYLFDGPHYVSDSLVEELLAMPR